MIGNFITEIISMLIISQRSLSVVYL